MPPIQPAVLMMASSTFGVYAIVQRQLQWSCITWVWQCTATSATLTAPFYEAALSVIAYSLR